MTTTTEVDAAPVGNADTAARGVRRSTVFTALFAVVGAGIGIRRLYDNSFMWHVRTGGYILDHGIPHSDPYSFSAPGTKWVAQSWLAELLYGILHRSVLGDFGLRLLGAVVGAALGALLFRIAYRACGNEGRAIALTALAFAVLLNVWSPRPLMLGLLAMTVLVFIVEFPDAPIARRPMIAVPVVMWLWVNVHGSFSIGFLYLAVHLTGRALDGHLPTTGRERTLLRATVVAALLTLVNPYGVSLPLFPVALMARGSVLRGVSEWQSPQFRELGPMFFGAFIVTCIVVLARAKPSRRDVLMTVVFVVLGLWAIRNVGLTAIVLLPVLARTVGPGAGVPRESRSRQNMLMLGVVVALAGLVFVHATGESNWDLESYPVAATQALQQHHLLGRRVATTDVWGGYLIATQYPQQRVFFDDRYDMYPLAVNHAYGALSTGSPEWSDTLDRYNIDVVMWPTHGPLPQLLALRPDWVRIYADPTAVIYARRTALTP